MQKNIKQSQAFKHKLFNMHAFANNRKYFFILFFQGAKLDNPATTKSFKWRNKYGKSQKYFKQINIDKGLDGGGNSWNIVHFGMKVSVPELNEFYIFKVSSPCKLYEQLKLMRIGHILISFGCTYFCFIRVHSLTVPTGKLTLMQIKCFILLQGCKYEIVINLFFLKI